MRRARPGNINLIATDRVHDDWIGFLCGTLRFTVLSTVRCSGFYAAAGAQYIVFTHEEVAEIISTYADLTSGLEGTVGYGTTTKYLGRPSGLACPAKPRWSTDVEGIGHWMWGGIDNFIWDVDQNIVAMADRDVKFRTGATCENRFCSVSRNKPWQQAPLVGSTFIVIILVSGLYSDLQDAKRVTKNPIWLFFSGALRWHHGGSPNHYQIGDYEEQPHANPDWV
ncbi:hypothetical protein K438DRAFT_1787402 [Mycena galopus ATCC 62051]|nr:hypothetical protein K438DRAFT_1787402 [Mycena galopus ATCC 62051]